MRITHLAPTGQEEVTDNDTPASSKGGSKTLTVGKLPKKGRYRAVKGRKAPAPRIRSGSPMKGARTSQANQAPDWSRPDTPLSPMMAGSQDEPSLRSSAGDDAGFTDEVIRGEYAQGGQVRRGWGKARGGC